MNCIKKNNVKNVAQPDKKFETFLDTLFHNKKCLTIIKKSENDY